MRAYVSALMVFALGRSALGYASVLRGPRLGCGSVSGCGLSTCQLCFGRCAHDMCAFWYYKALRFVRSNKLCVSNVTHVVISALVVGVLFVRKCVRV